MEPHKHQTSKGSFEVKLLRPEDAEKVTRLFRAVYGDDYPIKLFYDPAALIEANKKGDYYSTVARSENGEIIGMHNLFRSAPSPDVYEWGVGLVHKDWRIVGVSRAIEIFMLEKVIPELGMHTVFGEAVTNHVAMQKHSQDYGFKPTALEVGLMPGEAYTGEGVTSGRVSTIICFRIYRNITQTVFLPENYKEAIKFLYRDFAAGRSLTESIDPIPSEGASRSQMDFFDFAKVARIAFQETGADFIQHLSDLENEAVSKGCLVIQVWLKLTMPWIGAVADVLRQKGFFLGGILPQWFDDDGLLMQKLFFTPDFESIQLLPDSSLRIRELVEADWRETCKK
jgi:hypothetical protein